MFLSYKTFGLSTIVKTLCLIHYKSPWLDLRRNNKFNEIQPKIELLLIRDTLI